MGSGQNHSHSTAPDEAEHGNDEAGGDERGAKPVFALAFVKDDLEEAQAGGDEGEADKVDADAFLEAFLASGDDFRGIVNQAGGEEQ